MIAAAFGLAFLVVAAIYIAENNRRIGALERRVVELELGREDGQSGDEADWWKRGGEQC